MFPLFLRSSLNSMSVTRQIRTAVIKALQDLYGQDDPERSRRAEQGQTEFSEKDFQVNQTKPEFEGDYTVVLFSLVKQLKKSPDAIGNELGQKLTADNPQLFTAYNLIKGFLTLASAMHSGQNFLRRMLQMRSLDISSNPVAG